jgi:hypothetical protein
MSLGISSAFKRERLVDLNINMKISWILRAFSDSLLGTKTTKSVVWIRITAERRKIDNENESLVSMYENER